MHALCSRISPTGVVVVVRLPDEAGFVGRYVDDETVRDMTSFIPNLLLTGAMDIAEVEESGRPEPDESVDAVQVSYVEPPQQLGGIRETASFTWLNLQTGEAGDFPPADVIAIVVRGLSVELTAAVAAERAAEELPDTPEGIDALD